MNLRHATALALVGWYLVAPPVRQPKGDQPYLDEHAQYRDWKTLETFNDLVKCQEVQEKARIAAQVGHLMPLPSPRGIVDTSPVPWIAQEADAECIATDDLRLKAK